MFLWVPVLAVGLLAGVLLGRGRPGPGPRWATGRPAAPAAPGRADLGLAGLDDAGGGRPPSSWRRPSLWRSGELPTRVGLGGARRPAGRLAAGRGGAAAGAAASAAGARAPTCPSTRRCAPGRRTWSPRPPACSALLPLGALLLAGGHRSRRPGRPRASTCCPVALVAGGFSALAAGIAVAGFLLTWLRPVRSNAPRPGGLTRPGCEPAVLPRMPVGRFTLWPWSPGPASTFARRPSAPHAARPSRRVSARPRSAAERLCFTRCAPLPLAPCSLSCRDRQPGWRPTRAASPARSFAPGRTAVRAGTRRRAVLGRRARSPARVL